VRQAFHLGDNVASLAGIFGRLPVLAARGAL
jgi:hypothetical protein